MAFPVINPILQFFDNSGNVLGGGKLFSYEPGTTTKKTTWSDENLSSANANPIILDSAGRCTIFLTDGAEYKFVLAPSTDTDPPANPIRTVDEVKSPSPMTAANIGAALYPRTTAEIAVGVTPSSYIYPICNVLRYGAVADSGTSDNSVAFANAALVAGECNSQLYVPEVNGGYFKITDEITLPSGAGALVDGEVRQATRNKNIFIAGDNSVIEGKGLLRGDNTTGAANVDKNCAVYADDKVGVVVRGLRISHCERGIQLRNCRNYQILNNTITDAPYDLTNSGTSPEADILVYSLASFTGRRGIISGNMCLSNNDIGIYHNANGFDVDVVVSQNVCVTLQNGGEASSGGNRRHAILVTYGGGSSGRTIVSNNICRNTKLTGIYRTGTTAPTVSHIIVNNYCSANGYDAANSLAAGIYLGDVATGDLIANNIVDDFRGTQQSTNGALVLNAANGRCTIRGNQFTNSQGHGVVLTGTASNATISHNLFSGNTLEDVVLNTNNTATLGANEILYNRFYKAVDTATCVYINTQAATNANRVIGNRAKGANKTTASSGENSFVTIAGFTTPVLIKDNEVETFYYGAFSSANIPAGRTFTSVQIDGNDFRDLNTGILLQRSSTNDCIPVCRNVFDTVATPVSGGAYIAERTHIYITLLGYSTAPTDGTWIAGDRVVFSTPAAGADPEAVCTTGGNAGTPFVWKAYANIDA